MSTLLWRYGGTTLPLDASSGLVIEGSEGLFGFPPVRVEGSDLDTGGAYIRDIVPRARRVLLNISALSDAARNALMALLPLGGRGTLIAQGVETRTLDVRVVGAQQKWEPWGWRISVTLDAEWPWWSGPAVSLEFARDAQPLFFPVPPVRVVSGAVYSETTVTVTGQAATWPTITITGPCDWVRIENITTGLALTLNAALGAGEVRTITMRPPATVTDGAGGNRMSEVSGHFWPLLPGANTVRIIAPGATDETVVTMVYYPAYAGAW